MPVTLRQEITRELIHREWSPEEYGEALDIFHFILTRRLDPEALARVIEETAKQYEAAKSPPELREGCRAIAAAVIAHVTGEGETTP